MDEEDEELDEGTDYANNFFDNGENYLDDDEDNLDEGGIYWEINTICLLSQQIPKKVFNPHNIRSVN